MITTKVSVWKPMQNSKKVQTMTVLVDSINLQNVQSISSLAGSVLPRRTIYKKSLLIEASKCPKKTMISTNRTLIDSAILINK